jgi:hypothetical protein
LADDVLNRREPWVSGDLIWAYSAVFAALGDAERAATLQGANDAVRRGDEHERWTDMSASDAALIERCYAKARSLISAEAWEQARLHGRTLAPEQAIASARRASEVGPNLHS